MYKGRFCVLTAFTARTFSSPLTKEILCLDCLCRPYLLSSTYQKNTLSWLYFLFLPSLLWTLTKAILCLDCFYCPTFSPTLTKKNACLCCFYCYYLFSSSYQRDSLSWLHFSLHSLLHSQMRFPVLTASTAPNVPLTAAMAAPTFFPPQVCKWDACLDFIYCPLPFSPALTNNIVFFMIVMAAPTFSPPLANEIPCISWLPIIVPVSIVTILMPDAPTVRLMFEPEWFMLGTSANRSESWNQYM